MLSLFGGASPYVDQFPDNVFHDGELVKVLIRKTEEDAKVNRYSLIVSAITVTLVLWMIVTGKRRVY